MKISILCLALLALPFSTFGAEPEKKKLDSSAKPILKEPQKEIDAAVADFKSACEKILKKDKKVKNASLRCGCVSRNLAIKLRVSEIVLLTKVYKGSKAAENELEREENLPLQDFELEVSQNCMANHRWKLPSK